MGEKYIRTSLSFEHLIDGTSFLPLLLTTDPSSCPTPRPPPHPLDGRPRGNDTAVEKMATQIALIYSCTCMEGGLHFHGLFRAFHT